MEIPLGIYEEITGQTELPPPVDEADFERRKHRRVPFGCRATIFPERKSGDNTPSVVMVRDMSIAGLSVLNAEPLKVGTPFIVEFRGRQDRPVKIRCTSARCEAGGSGGTQFVIGGTFESLLTAELPASEIKPEAPPPPLAELVAPPESGDPVDEDAIADALLPDKAESETKDQPAAAPQASESGPQPEPEAADEPQAAEQPQDVEAETEPAMELIDKESQEKISARLKRSEPEPAPPPLQTSAPATTPAAPPPAAPTAPVRASSIFSSSGGKVTKLSDLPDGTYDSPELAAPKASAPAPPPEAAGPVFRVIPMPPLPEPEKHAAAEMELGPQIHHSSSTAAGKTHEILARVKETLVAQTATIQKQQQQLDEERQKTQKLGEELADVKRMVQELQARVQEDDSAIADLATFLDKNGNVVSPPQNSQAA